MQSMIDEIKCISNGELQRNRTGTPLPSTTHLYVLLDPASKCQLLTDCDVNGCDTNGLHRLQLIQSDNLLQSVDDKCPNFSGNS